MLLKSERVCEFPFPKTSPASRERNFAEVQLPFTLEQAMAEADRCLRCGNPVCIDICPLQTDVRGMCDAVASGDLATAYHRVRETNALPGTTARCCPQLDSLCEAACAIGTVGSPIASGMIQRFVADWERTQSRQPNPGAAKDTGKSVVIIGGGPAGLAAAELLRRYGHSVTIYEELPVLGGTAWYGIPDYHLPKDVLQYEVGRVVDMGVHLKTGVKAGRDVSLSDLRAEFDAVLVATGAKDVPRVDTPGADLKGVYDGYGFLEEVFARGVENYLKNPSYDLGRRVLVIGGGDSALDCARTALRLTGGTVTIVYRRTELEMPVDRVLVEEGREEGLRLEFLMAPKAYDGSEGRLASVTMSVMELDEVDASGRRSPRPTGEERVMECDSVIIAIGRWPNSFVQSRSGLKTGPKNSIAVDDRCMTSLSGVFAAGDVVTGESLVVKAMAKGREAAQRIHEYLLDLEDRHESLYERYFVKRATGEGYDEMLDGKEEGAPPI